MNIDEYHIAVSERIRLARKGRHAGRYRGRDARVRRDRRHHFGRPLRGRLSPTIGWPTAGTCPAGLRRPPLPIAPATVIQPPKTAPGGCGRNSAAGRERRAPAKAAGPAHPARSGRNGDARVKDFSCLDMPTRGIPLCAEAGGERRFELHASSPPTTGRARAELDLFLAHQPLNFDLHVAENGFVFTN